MDHRRAEDLGWSPAPDQFFAGRAWFGPLSHVDPKGLNALGVMFEPSARTHWHTHPEGQVLYIVAGAGRVVTEAGDRAVVGPGDVVYSPPGEVHWHGAGPDAFMVHLSLTTGGDTEWLDRPVLDDEYRDPGSG